jgi:uncharacterized membrane protein
MVNQPVARRGFDGIADLYLATVVVAGVAVVGASLRHIVADGVDARHLVWLGIALLTVLAGPLSVRLPFPNCRVSFSDALIFLSILVFGGDFGVLTAALDGCAASTRKHGSVQKTAFNTAGMAISARLSASLFAGLLRRSTSASDPSTVDLLLPVTMLALAQYVVNTLLVSTAVALKDHASFAATWRNASPWAAVAYLTGSLAAAAVFVAVHGLGVVLAFTVVPFPMVLYFTFRVLLNHRVPQKVAASGRPDPS